jgi:small GTP-binding protein
VIQKKICMLGAFAVGKTSLVERYVKSLFSDRYLSTVGVKIDKKVVEVDGREVTLVLWDLAGEDEFQEVQISYLRGASGSLLVVDGTRKSTLDTARLIHRRVEEEIGDLPSILVVNKCDLADEWEVNDAELDELGQRGWTVVCTSAKSGEGVEEAFRRLATRLLGGDR